jgi:hypothetical protein
MVPAIGFCGAAAPDAIEESVLITITCSASLLYTVGYPARPSH